MCGTAPTTEDLHTRPSHAESCQELGSGDWGICQGRDCQLPSPGCHWNQELDRGSTVKPAQEHWGVGGGGWVALAAEATAEVQLGVPKAETHRRDWQRIPRHHPTVEVCPNLCLWEGPRGGTLRQRRGLTGTPSSESEGLFIPWKNFW